jgi:hypothetical protein
VLPRAADLDEFLAHVCEFLNLSKDGNYAKPRGKQSRSCTAKVENRRFTKIPRINRIFRLANGFGRRPIAVALSAKVVGMTSKPVGVNLKAVAASAKAVGVTSNPVVVGFNPVGAGSKAVGVTFKPVAASTKAVGVTSKPVGDGFIARLGEQLTCRIGRKGQMPTGF